MCWMKIIHIYTRLRAHASIAFECGDWSAGIGVRGLETDWGGCFVFFWGGGEEGGRNFRKFVSYKLYFYTLKCKNIKNVENYRKINHR
jgi:hypothetical protein